MSIFLKAQLPHWNTTKSFVGQDDRSPLSGEWFQIAEGKLTLDQRMQLLCSTLNLVLQLYPLLYSFLPQPPNYK
jgi:hypothetical protein